jgi:hypothetical protein
VTVVRLPPRPQTTRLPSGSATATILPFGPRDTKTRLPTGSSHFQNLNARRGCFNSTPRRPINMHEFSPTPSPDRCSQHPGAPLWRQDDPFAADWNCSVCKPLRDAVRLLGEPRDDRCVRVCGSYVLVCLGCA